MVQNSEKMKSEDKKKKEGIEIRNEVDTLIYNTEKSLEEHKAKLQPAEVEEIQKDINELKDELVWMIIKRWKMQLEKLENLAKKIGRALYS